MATAELTLKLLISKNSHRVLFAEAGKDVVHFLFQILMMPLGSIMNLLNKDVTMGSIAMLYKSVERLDQSYIPANQNKNVLLNPTPPSLSGNPLFAPGPSPSTTAITQYYTCSEGSKSCPCKTGYTDIKHSVCPSCYHFMDSKIRYVSPDSWKLAFDLAERSVSYILMDDLTVIPMSKISTIALLKKFNIKDLDSLEERTVKIGRKEGLELLKASVQSKKVLTDAFLGKEPAVAVGLKKRVGSYACSSDRNEGANGGEMSADTVAMAGRELKKHKGEELEE